MYGRGGAAAGTGMGRGSIGGILARIIRRGRQSSAARENGSARMRSVAISTSVSPKLYSKKPATVIAVPASSAPAQIAARAGSSPPRTLAIALARNRATIAR